MNPTKNSAMLAIGAAMVVALGGCADGMYAGRQDSGYPSGQVSSYPSSNQGGYGRSGYAAPNSAYPTSTEWGRVTSIQYVPAGTNMAGSESMSNNGILGGVVGAVIGGVVGHQIGGGSGRDVATVLGAGAGAYAGNRIATSREGVTTAAGYRVSIQTDQGATRVFEVPSTGELRVGSRVRVDNGMIQPM
jgi:outer membrane lipoprotein SlyB